MQLKILQTISDITFFQLTAFLCEFILSKIKRNLISNTIKFVYELFHELPNDLRLKDYRKSRNEKKISNLGGDTGWCSVSPQKINFGNNGQNLHKRFCPVLPDFLTFCQIFCHWL